MTQPTPDKVPASPSAPSPTDVTGSGATKAPNDPRPHRDPDADLASHDLSDHDERLFRPRQPWHHLTAIGLSVLLAGLILIGGAATHLGAMSGGTIANAVLLPVGVPVNIRLDAGEQRMLYTERGSGLTRCAITDGANAPVSVAKTSPVILQGADVLWHGESIFTAPKAGDYTITCQGGADARVGRPVGTLDVVLTVLATGIGGLTVLTGLGLALWGRARSRKAAAEKAPAA